MKEEKNPNKHENYMYSLLSNMETTFILVFDEKANTLWVSPPQPRDKFIRSIFFVLSYLLKPYFQHTHPWLYDEIVRLSNNRRFDVQRRPSNQLRKLSNSIASFTRSRIRLLKSNLEEECDFQLLKHAWENTRRFIGSGRTCFVFSVNIGFQMYALKMIDIFKPASGAMEELENEYKVLSSLKGSNIYNS